MGTTATRTPSRPTDKLLLRLGEVAELMGVSVKTIMRLIDRGELRALKVGRVWRVRRAEVDAYVKRNERQWGGEPSAAFVV